MDSSNVIFIYKFEDGLEIERLKYSLTTEELIRLVKEHGTVTVDYRTK